MANQKPFKLSTVRKQRFKQVTLLMTQTQAVIPCSVPLQVSPQISPNGKIIESRKLSSAFSLLMLTTPSWSLRPNPKVSVVSLTHRARFSESITSCPSTSIFSAIVSSDARSLEAFPCYIHYWQKCGIFGKLKWKHSCLTFGFAGNCLAPPKTSIVT